MIRKLRKNKLFLAGIILSVGSLVILFLNQGFHFASYKHEIKIEVENIEDFDKISELENIASLNRNELEISIQNETRTSVEEQMKSLNIENAVINEVIKNTDFQDIYRNLIGVSLLILVSGILSIYYFIFRNKLKDFNLKEISRFTGEFVINYAISTIMFIGLLSILSRIYSVRDIDLYSVIILNLFSIFFFALFLAENFENKLSNELLSSKVQEYIKPLRVITIILVLITFATLIFSLGIKFIIPGVLLIISIIFATFTYFINYESINRPVIKVKSESSQQESKSKSSSKRKFQKRSKKKGK